MALARIRLLVSALWAGSLWTVCGLVAPTLFSVLGDPSIAGRLAARFFRAEALIGVVAAAFLLYAMSRGPRVAGSRAAYTALAIGAAAPLIGTFGLGPSMQSARLAGDAARAGMLHGLASVLFLAACLATLALAWLLSRPAE